MNALNAQINELLNRNRVTITIAAAITAVLIVTFAGNELGRLVGMLTVIAAILLATLIVWAKTNNPIYAVVVLVAGFWAGNQGLFAFGGNIGATALGVVQGLLQLAMCAVVLFTVIVALITTPVWVPRLRKMLSL